MSEALSFPGLGLELEVNRVAFTVGDMQIYWYGIIIAAAFLAAAAYALARARTFGLDGDRVIDVILGSVLAGIFGARLYYVAFQWDTYAGDPGSVFDIRSGGLAVYGGIIGGVLAAILVCKWRKVKLLPMLDLAAGSLFIGQAIGRWGNFVNIEAFGSTTDVPWRMEVPAYTLRNLGVEVASNAPVAVHPTFFYESAWCLLGFLFLLWFTRHRRFDGQLWLIYLGWYGIGRFFIERLRLDSLMLGTMRVSQIVALFCVLVAAFLLYTTLSKIRRANDPDFMPLYVRTDESKAILAGTFYNQAKAAQESGDEKAEGETKTEEVKSETETESKDETEPENEPESVSEAETEAESETKADT